MSWFTRKVRARTPEQKLRDADEKRRLLEAIRSGLITVSEGKKSVRRKIRKLANKS